MEGKRYPEIDLLKSVCILAVVYIHSHTTVADTYSLGVLYSDLIMFAVPGFFFASGFLFDKKKYSTAQITKKKLVRLLPPYLFCSLCLQFLNVPGLSVKLENLDTGQLIFNLIFGNTVGIYYFTFVLFYLFAGSLVLRRIPDRWILGLWGLSALLLLLFVKGFIDCGPSLFLYLRHPFFYLLAYLSGWIFSLNHERACSFFKEHGGAVFFSGVVLMLTLIIFTRSGGKNFFSFPVFFQLYIYLSITLVIIAGMWLTKYQRVIYFVSNYSYGIYLLHFPIVYACHSVYAEWPVDYSFASAFVSWCAGIAGSILIIFIVQKISGPCSKYLVGC